MCSVCDDTGLICDECGESKMICLCTHPDYSDCPEGCAEPEQEDEDDLDDEDDEDDWDEDEDE